jgi:hypothetical protein
VSAAVCAVVALIAGGCGGGGARRPAAGAETSGAPLVVHGNTGETTSAGCGVTSNLQVADVTAHRPARVLSARLADADPGLHVTDVLGAPEAPVPVPRRRPVKGHGKYGLHLTQIEIGSSKDFVDPEALAVHLPGGVPISTNPKRPTALFVTVSGSCRGQARPKDLVARSVEVTVRTGGQLVRQRLTTDIQLCVGRTAPASCP